MKKTPPSDDELNLFAAQKVGVENQLQTFGPLTNPADSDQLVEGLVKLGYRWTMESGEYWLIVLAKASIVWYGRDSDRKRAIVIACHESGP